MPTPVLPPETLNLSLDTAFSDGFDANNLFYERMRLTGKSKVTFRTEANKVINTMDSAHGPALLNQFAADNQAFQAALMAAHENENKVAALKQFLQESTDKNKKLLQDQASKDELRFCYLQGLYRKALVEHFEEDNLAQLKKLEEKEAIDPIMAKGKDDLNVLQRGQFREVNINKELLNKALGPTLYAVDPKLVQDTTTAASLTQNSGNKSTTAPQGFYVRYTRHQGTEYSIGNGHPVPGVLKTLMLKGHAHSSGDKKRDAYEMVTEHLKYGDRHSEITLDGGDRELVCHMAEILCAYGFHENQGFKFGPTAQQYGFDEHFRRHREQLGRDVARIALEGKADSSTLDNGLFSAWLKDDIQNTRMKKRGVDQAEEYVKNAATDETTAKTTVDTAQKALDTYKKDNAGKLDQKEVDRLTDELGKAQTALKSAETAHKQAKDEHVRLKKEFDELQHNPYPPAQQAPSTPSVTSPTSSSNSSTTSSSSSEDSSTTLAPAPPSPKPSSSSESSTLLTPPPPPDTSSMRGRKSSTTSSKLSDPSGGTGSGSDTSSDADDKSYSSPFNSRDQRSMQRRKQPLEQQFGSASKPLDSLNVPRKPYQFSSNSQKILKDLGVDPSHKRPASPNEPQDSKKHRVK